MTAIDLFSGCGGFLLGMRWAGVTTVKVIGQSLKTAWLASLT